MLFNSFDCDNPNFVPKVQRFSVKCKTVVKKRLHRQISMIKR